MCEKDGVNSTGACYSVEMMRVWCAVVSLVVCMSLSVCMPGR